jgi:hypothetical protein
MTSTTIVRRPDDPEIAPALERVARFIPRRVTAETMPEVGNSMPSASNCSWHVIFPSEDKTEVTASASTRGD